MPLPAPPPAGTAPPEYVTWATEVADTASDHETRIDNLEAGAPYASDADVAAEAAARTAADADLQTQINTKADNGAVVKLVGNQSIDGIKVFTSTPGVPGASLAADQAAGTASPRTLGTGATQAAAGNDSRLSDARTPAAHAATHGVAGSDPVTLAESQITGLPADLAAKAPIANPVFTGNPQAPTPTPGDSDTSIATTAFVQQAVVDGTVGLLDYRGSYNASTNLFPAAGGSGTAGAILKSDFWICSVQGTLGGTVVKPGDMISALIDGPGQTAGNWDLLSHDLGYAPEDAANKSNDTTMAGDSATLYPTQHAAKGYADAKVIDSIADADTAHAPSRNAVFDALALKADAAALGTAAAKNVGQTVLDPGTGKLEFAMPTGGLVTGTTHSYLATDRGLVYRRSNAGAAMSDTLPLLTNTVADIGYTVKIHNEDTVLAAVLTMNASGGALFRGGTGVTAATTVINFGCRQTFVWDGTQWLFDAGNANVVRRSGVIVAGDFPQFVDSAGNVVTDSGVGPASFVPVGRAINTTLPLRGGGPMSADLNLTVDDATSSATGEMSALDYNRVRKEWNAYSDFGLVGDLRSVFEVTVAGTQVVMTSGSNIVNIPNAGAATPFLAGRDEGKRITVTGAGAGGAMLVGVIGVINTSTQCTVLVSVGGAALNASTTVTASTTVAIGVQWGTDNTAAINTMVATINADPFPTPKIAFGHGGRPDWTNAWGFPIQCLFTKPVAWEGVGGGHTADVGDYTKIGGTRWAWWGTSSDGGTNFGAMVTITTPAGGAAVPTLVRAVATVHTPATTNAVGALPTAPANGNMLLATISIGAATGITVTPPSGWFLLSGPDLPAAGAAEFFVYWKPAASDPASWTWVLSAARGTVVTIHEVTGVRTDVAPQIAVAQQFTGSTTGNTPVVTTTAAGCIVIGIAGVVKTSSSAAITFTPPGSTTLDAQGGTAVPVAANTSTGHIHDTVNQAAAGNTTARTITASTAPTGGVAYTVTMAPAPGSGSVQSIKRPSFKAGWFDGRNGDQNQALYLLKLASVHGVVLDDGILFMDALAQGLWCDIGTTSAEAKDTTRFMFGRLCFRQLDNPTITAPTTTPTTTTFTSALTTAGQAMTLASAAGFGGPSGTGPGYAWVMTRIGQPVLVHYTSVTGAVLNGCTVSVEDTVNAPTPVSGSFVVPCTPSNGGAMKLTGGTGANTCCGSVEDTQISFGTTWGPAAIDCGNADSIVFGQIDMNGGSNVNDGAINRQRRPGVRLNGSATSVTLAARNNVFRDIDPGGSPAGPLGGISAMGVDSTGALLMAPSGPNYVDLQQMGNGAPVPTVETGAFLDWTGNGLWRPGPIGNGATAIQALTAAVGNIVTGTIVPVPAQGWQVGTRLRFEVPLHKTGVAGGLSWSAGIRQHSSLTVGGGTLIATVTFTATAVADTGILVIELVCTSLGGAGTALGQFELSHNLAATGLSTGAVTVGTVDATAAAGKTRGRPLMAAFNTAAAAAGPTFLFMEINPITAATVMGTDPPVGVQCLKAANP